MFERYSAYSILVISIGGFIWLTSCAAGEYGTKTVEGMVRSYDKLLEARIEHGCKDVVIKTGYSSDKIECKHPEHTIIFRGSEILCSCK
jgi:hypothetical protein